MTSPLLDVRDLRVALPGPQGPLPALRGVDLQLQRGETVGLIGESGCGKSMTALAVMGLLPEGAQVSGSMRLQGQELVGLDDRAMARLRGARLAMVFQEPMTALNPLHSIGRQVAEPLRLHRGLDAAAARAEALRLLQRVRLPQAQARLDAHPHQLSGGQRQRVGLAMALACGPELLLADEPTTALDATLQREVLELVAELVREDGMALLLISHDLGVMAHCVQRVVVMYAGQVIEQGPTAGLLSHPAHPYTRALLQARPRLGLPRGTRLSTIAGRVPSLAEIARLGGCSFAPRCGWTQEACRRQAVALQDLGGADRHAVRCLRAGEWNAADASP
jgi:peptide/nickel transport system ATP-binding protein